MVSQDDFLVITRSEVVAVINPLLLDELELPVYIGIDHHDDNAMVTVIFAAIFDLSVGQTTAQQAASIRQGARGVKCILVHF